MSCDRSNFRGRGFSLLEVMAVLVIIGMIAGLVTVSVRSRMMTARRETARIEVSNIAQAVEIFYTVEARYPTNDEGLEILTRRTENIAEPLLDAVPTDPWNRPYEYVSPGRDHPYEVYSLGADGVEGGEGADADIVNWDLKKKPDAR